MSRQFGWDLPPGVSGLEPQIAGYPELVRHVECEGTIDAAKVMVVIEGTTEGPFPLAATGQDEIDCPFKGELDMQLVDDEAIGDCPVCWTEIRVPMAFREYG